MIPNIPPLIKEKQWGAFFVPPTLEDDFTRYLYTDVPHANYTFEQVRDWYDRVKPDYDPKYIRATTFPVGWKSKMGNADNADNFKTNYEHTCLKGDLVVDVEDPERILLFTWRVAHNPNNQATQAHICNMSFTVERKVPEVTDDNGYLVKEETTEVIVPPIPALASIYDGRPDYIATPNTPGIIPNHILVVQVQFNQITKYVRIGDEFDYDDYRYRIVNKDTVQINTNYTNGVIALQAMKVAGGALYDTQ